MIYNFVTATLITAALGGVGAWKAQDWRYREQIATLRTTYAQELSASISEARAKEQAINHQLTEARNAATKRETTLRRDAAGARTELDGLRDDLAASRLQLPDATPTACVDRVTTVGELFAACAGEYQILAAQADRHASDVKTLTEAWPR